MDMVTFNLKNTYFIDQESFLPKNVKVNQEVFLQIRDYMCEVEDENGT